MFKVEADVRGWVRERGGDRVFWVEPGRGGTVGLPDSLLAMDHGITFWLEIKLGQAVKGGFRARLRPAQRLVLRRAALQGLPVGILIGVQGTDRVVVVAPGPSALGPGKEGLWPIKTRECGVLFGEAPVYGVGDTCTANLERILL